MNNHEPKQELQHEPEMESTLENFKKLFGGAKNHDILVEQSIANLSALSELFPKHDPSSFRFNRIDNESETMMSLELLIKSDDISVDSIIEMEQIVFNYILDKSADKSNLHLTPILITASNAFLSNE